jgi:hypothetical protein
MRRPLYPLRSALLAAVALVLIRHFGTTLVYLAPINPGTLLIAPQVDSYMNPWFAQDWRLFAPDPIADTRTLLVECRLRGPDGRSAETAPADVSTPLWDALARQRFSPAASLARLQAHIVQLWLQKDEGLRRLEARQSPEVNGLVEALRGAERPRRALAAHLLARLGAAYCDQRHGPGQTVATRVTLSILRFPRFSQRQLPDAAGETRIYPFEWMPYEPVAPLRAHPDHG